MGKYGKELGVIDHIDDGKHVEIDAKAEAAPGFRNSPEGRRKTQ